MTSTYDPIVLEIIRNRLDAIAEEMEAVLLRSAHSIILKEGADASSAVFSAAGEVIAQSTSHPLHLGALLPGVEAILAKFPVETMKDGDVFCLNDPYAGGTHLPDLICVVPGFAGGRVVVLGAALAHHQDFGGMAPGSMTINATEHFQEGLILSPVKLLSEGEKNDTLFTIIERNVRVPDTVIGDIWAQVAAGRKVAQRTLELIEEFGLATFEEVVAQLITRAEELTRREIGALPDGVYAFEDCIDNDGVELDRRIIIRAKVIIKGTDMEVDFTGTSKQARGPVNTSPTGALGPAFYVLRAITDSTIPNNSGCFRPLKVTIPEGCILNPTRPAPVSIRAQTLKRVVDVLFGALSQAAPDRVPAAAHGSLTCVSYGGTSGGHGPWVYMECSVGGTGATARGDGVDNLDTDVANAGNIPAEALEIEHPFRLWMNRFRPDSGGAGLHRGGLGIERLIELREGEATVSHRSDRHASQPWGVLGGLAGAPWATFVERRDGEKEKIPARKSTQIVGGDRLRMFTGGGGGYGDPLGRPAEAVAQDVASGRVSREAAQRDYAVVIGPAGEVDAEETDRLRTSRRAERDGHQTPHFDRGELLGAETRHSLVLADRAQDRR